MDQPVADSQPISSATVTSDGITVESNTGTQEHLQSEIDGLAAAVEAQKTGKPLTKPAKEEKTATDLPPAAEVPLEKPKGRPRNDPQARIDEITAKHREAERRAETAERELAALRAPKQSEAPKPVVAASEDPEPNPADYPAGEYDPNYFKACGAHAARQEFKKQSDIAAKAHARDREITAVETRMASFGKRLSAGVKDVPAFLETIAPEITGLQTSDAQALLEPTKPITAANAIADCISNSQNPAALMQYLHDHTDIFQRLLTLHSIEAIWEMGKLEARQEAAHSGPAKTPIVSQAKPPMKPVGGAPVVNDDAPGDDASDEEHVAYMNRKELARRRGRG